MDNLERALSFALELKEHLDDVLSVFPKGGTLYNSKKGIRKHSYKGYTAFYHVPDAETVEVLHVINLRKPLNVRGIDFQGKGEAFSLASVDRALRCIGTL